MSETIVVKIGSNILASEKGLNEKTIEQLAWDISAAHDEGYDMVVVSSGAVAAGRYKLSIEGRIRDINLKQAVAAVGQSSLVWAYEKAFGAFGKKVAQVLLTRDVFSDRKRFINAGNTLNTLLSLKVIPIINENDTVSVEELKFGDNDMLAALVATLLNASKLIILSDIDGLYTADPRKNSKAELIGEVAEITDEIEALAGGAGTISGTGGMYSKVKAAKIATAHGVTVTIINGKKSGQLASVLRGGTAFGTTFAAKAKKHGARKSWIASYLHTRGSVCLDEGAAKAVVSNGKSLLPSGVRSIEGSFERGDAVYCITLDGKKIAKGIVNYGSSELLRIAGHKTSEIEGLLGYKYSDEIIHRNNLTLL
ncbi:glutamate 5-kinase [Candidatus Magnetomonas plexicatena]|uniref:glutamate 5-kinase n=1 Tax=Candidatus Magnetomonas plexicatena TaxID=2552947 RepID=UPI001C7720DD|nr:glutamate 5-kinase [Nitrospirales bacterium LBB_01]